MITHRHAKTIWREIRGEVLLWKGREREGWVRPDVPSKKTKKRRLTMDALLQREKVETFKRGGWEGRIAGQDVTPRLRGKVGSQDIRG